MRPHAQSWVPSQVCPREDNWGNDLTSVCVRCAWTLCQRKSPPRIESSWPGQWGILGQGRGDWWEMSPPPCSRDQRYPQAHGHASNTCSMRWGTELVGDLPVPSTCSHGRGKKIIYIMIICKGTLQTKMSKLTGTDRIPQPHVLSRFTCPCTSVRLTIALVCSW